MKQNTKSGYFRIGYSRTVENLACPNNLEYIINDLYAVKTKHGYDAGTFLGYSSHPAPTLLNKPYKELAFYEDILQVEYKISPAEQQNILKNNHLIEEYTGIAQKRAQELNLPISIIHTYIFPNRDKAIFSFVSEEKKTDFRVLAKDLWQSLKLKIELHKVYNRDFAALLDEIGTCGRRFCCSSCGSHKKNFPHNNTSVDNGYHSPQLGICGKPKCCLNYEGIGHVSKKL